MNARRRGTGGPHADWLRLIDISGPFPSLPVLNRVFPQGLDADDDPTLRGDLRVALDELAEDPEDGDLQGRWLDHVVRILLGYTEEDIRRGERLPVGTRVHLEQHDEWLSPTLAIVDAEKDGQARLLVWQVGAEQRLDQPMPDSRWKASPATRMVELLRGSEVRLGLLTNGEEWMLIHAPAQETVGYATWLASLWVEERTTLRAFRSLLGVGRVLGAADREALEDLYEQSTREQQELTEELGLQVRHAVELLVQAIDGVDRNRGRELLRGISDQEAYEASVSALMRIVFVLYAEERGLLPLDEPFYEANYALSTLEDRLQEEADRVGEDVLRRRHAAWCRLLATFRAIHGGVRHEEFQLPAYGGGLFDPDRFPFLEGRRAGSGWKSAGADPPNISDRTVLEILRSVQFLGVRQERHGVEARRLSFRALGVEQIGHVYESLLDHTAVRAQTVVLGLVGKAGEEPEVAVSDLEAWSEEGEDELVEQLKGLTGKQARSIEKGLAEEFDDADGRWLAACDNDEELLESVRPFHGLVRSDDEGYPTVIPECAVYVTAGTDRRSTGTHYTPPELTQPIVEYALQPLVYEGPSEGRDRSNWVLRAPKEILDLKICDMACGSGAFLVQVCRYLAERLVEAWQLCEEANPGKVVITPEGDVSAGDRAERSVPRDAVERLTLATRLVAERCLYGVDKNPMAVEMAKLSLWLVTMEKQKAFEFLDHAIKPGDALLGVTDVEQILAFHPNPEESDSILGTLDLFDEVRLDARHSVAKAAELRRKLEQVRVLDVRDVESKRALHEESEASIESVKLMGDAVMAAAISATRESDLSKNLRALGPKVSRAVRGADAGDLFPEVDAVETEIDRLLSHGLPGGARQRSCFHWPLEFAEVFDGENAGFDAIVGNPPFQGGQRITGELGTDYRNYLIRHIAAGARGSADLCAYFFLRATHLLRQGGCFGLLATNTISQGDTREVGLAQMEAGGVSLMRAISSQKWPGAANLEVAHVWRRRGAWEGGHVLNGAAARGITPYLSVPGRVVGEPYRLEENKGKSFQGSIVLGLGFVLEPEEAEELIARDERNRDVLFPYLNGQDLNSRPDQSASRWVINFFDWPLDRTARGRWETASDDRRKKWLRDGRVLDDYPEPVAADYPDCLAIVDERVKPERTRKKPDGSFVVRYPRSHRWWQFAERSPALYTRIAGMQAVLARSRVSNLNSIARVRRGIVFSEATVVFALEEWGEFGVVQSSVHTLWLESRCSSLRTDVRYTPSDCFDTFAFPEILDVVEQPAECYGQFRQAWLKERQIGLTECYRELNDPSCRESAVERLREHRASLDQSIAEAYGWTDVELGHDFHKTPRGVRFTVAGDARDELLGRLLELNHSRYAQAAGR